MVSHDTCMIHMYDTHDIYMMNIHYIRMQPVMIVPETLAPPQLLNLLSSEKIRSSTNKHPIHTLPLVFACEVNRGVVTFTQLQQPVTKKNLQSDKCYLLSYKDVVANIISSCLIGP